jgi:hypothetical protein
MLVFAASDKGGAGRSVTSSNVAYRRALQGGDCCYLDFDFGSPTSGVIFDLPHALAGVAEGGLHSYLVDGTAGPRRIDIWTESERDVLSVRPAGAGRLTLLPGDIGSGEFSIRPGVVDRCVDLLVQADAEYDLVIVDLSAGRSYATEIVLTATAAPALRNVEARWLIFHRWTRQHIIAAAGLVHGSQGILQTGTQLGHDPVALQAAVQFVRTAVLDPASPGQAVLRPEQLAWLDVCNRRLQDLAGREKAGRSSVLGQIPFDPALQWQEQLLCDNDVWLHRTANQGTIDAFDDLAKKIVDDDTRIVL